MSDSNITCLVDVAMITCVVKAGMSDVILQAARDIGAVTGSISYHGRGHGARERLGLLGIAVESEKEIVSILVSTEQQDIIFNALFRAGKLDIPGNGYMYITPIEKLATYIPDDMVKKLKESS